VAQFDVYRNPDKTAGVRVPYLLDIQNDFLDHLSTRIVIPLYVGDKPAGTLTPLVEIEGQELTMATQELAAIPRRVLSSRVTNVANSRDEIIAALDLLITGI